jgi:hypothetical protein
VPAESVKKLARGPGAFLLPWGGSSMGRQLLPPWRQFLPEALAMNVQRRASKPGHSAQAAG